MKAQLKKHEASVEAKLNADFEGRVAAQVAAQIAAQEPPSTRTYELLTSFKPRVDPLRNAKRQAYYDVFSSFSFFCSSPYHLLTFCSPLSLFQSLSEEEFYVSSTNGMTEKLSLFASLATTINEQIKSEAFPPKTSDEVKEEHIRCTTDRYEKIYSSRCNTSITQAQKLAKEIANMTGSLLELGMNHAHHKATYNKIKRSRIMRLSKQKKSQDECKEKKKAARDALKKAKQDKEEEVDFDTISDAP
jgi:hypothetical protein